MKLATFSDSGSTRVGVAKDDGLIDLSIATPHLPTEMTELLDESVLSELRGLSESEPHLAFDEINLKSPVLHPRKILGIGLNYRAHAEETGMEIPEYPVVFTKQPTSINGPYADIYWSEDSFMLDYECELAIIIGKRCRRVPVENAPAVIAGFAVTNDLSVRDWQSKSNPPQFMMGKSWDTHCPLGPYITTPDEVDPHNLRITTHVNGEKRQDSNTNDLIFNCYEIINYLSTAFTLEPGDVIATGTPAGVAAVMKPQKWLSPGDVVKVEIEKLGYIENRVIEEPATVTVY